MTTLFYRLGGLSSRAYSASATLRSSRPIASRSGDSLKTPSLAIPSRSFSSANGLRRTRPPIPRRVHAGVVAAGSLLVAASLFGGHSAHDESPNVTESKHYIRLSEVKKHGKDSERKWVTKGVRVFDITDWIAAHPGGPVILQAVGGAIDKYWDIFSIHKKQDVYDVLEEYFIGEIDPQDLVDGKLSEDKVEDPFVSDPSRDPRLQQHTAKPCNAETPSSCLGDFITPTEVFYVRNHLWVPQVDEETHVLNVELPDGTEKQYTLADLKSRFKPFSVTATLQCTGNRRKHMSDNAKPATGLQWEAGAISNTDWTGVRLTDLLEDAGFPVNDWNFDEAKHVHFIGSEAYAGSIPIAKAVDPQGDVILAYEMGGKTLSRDHGYPLRALVPGHTAARSVKWLEKIVLAEDECQSAWQQRDYKCFGPNQTPKDVDFASAPAIQEMPIQSSITALKSISSTSAQGRAELQRLGLEEDAIKVEGYAYSGGGRRVIRVDISADDGQSWSQAAILPDQAQGHKSWSWKRWESVIPKRLAGKAFVVKAVDDSYNNQPESYEAQYNFRGNLVNAWHRVRYVDEEKG
ncbi:hypothetical protein LTR10_016598 [Elasticomyces elasticus]|uniref:Nitrate reductase [NADPH] n=1 Tax=Exophiala sideris TaxID=1016849 RepID=A0ABR0JKI5_9EURO|nr:hypothetical protein LTR10_016598 [Elasticomyces elasticus]KAK5035243.1 hypothetical protein LTS07_002679 [Exophiala sideris]KAK5039405.1 hypothetical protein LTR13_003662 [Exophiala sideris]KAK5066167.1 hypothetical protein LTR69_002685 [Exophiala sideris]KAK5186844.1 hypothetical protein LTR44_000850 [Eurotiomycetes sp. CCFEE 6388]